jgi:hypothetical protein
MGLHIIVDGYNLIRRSSDMAPLDQADPELGRERLLDRLAGYKRVKGHRITVVFDGGAQNSVFDSKGQEKGIGIRFSRHGESADAVIKRMAGKERERALVVSSDREVAQYSASRGAAVIGSAEFEEKLAMAEYFSVKGAFLESEEEAGWLPDTRKKGPKKRPPKKRRRNRRKTDKL